MYTKFIYLSIFFIITACNEQSKWKGPGNFEINRQESFNYSEMLSGELDSTTKSQLENYKENEKQRVKNVKDESYIQKIKNLYKKIFQEKKNSTKFQKKVIKD